MSEKEEVTCPACQHLNVYWRQKGERIVNVDCSCCGYKMMVFLDEKKVDAEQFRKYLEMARRTTDKLKKDRKVRYKDLIRQMTR